jgi:hypothetical protein
LAILDFLLLSQQQYGATDRNRKWHSLQKATGASIIGLRGYFFDLLEDCSG